MITIGRERYRAAVDAAGKALDDRLRPPDIAAAVIRALGMTIERTPEERIAAFVAAVRALELDQLDALATLADTVARHFPEVREP